MFDKETQEIIDYLNNKDVSFEDKKIYCSRYADEISLKLSQKDANKAWEKFKVYFDYAPSLTDEEKYTLSKLYNFRSDPIHPAIGLLAEYSKEINRNTTLTDSIFYRANAQELMIARELCQRFVDDTEIDSLAHIFFEIATGIYNERCAVMSEREAAVVGYNTFVKLFSSKLFAKESLDHYLEMAKEAFDL